LLIKSEKILNQCAVINAGKWSFASFMRTSQDLACQSHRIFVSLIAFLELWLALRYETDHFNSSCPRVLNKGSVLDLDIQTSKFPSHIGTDVVLINIMNASISSVLWGSYIVIFVTGIAQLVVEMGVMNFITKCV